MNLKDLREYIANVIDYDPSANVDYNRQVDNIINHYYRMLFSSKEFTFAQREKKISVYTDYTDTLTGTFTGTFTEITSDASNTFPTWVEGNIISIDGTEHTIVYLNVSSNTATIKQRYIRLPVDCVALLQVARRSMSISPTDVGRFIPMTRFEDEYYNLPLDEVNIPNYWVMYDGINLTAPVGAPTVGTTTVSAGQGVRKVRVAQTYVQYDNNGQAYELESGISPFTSVIELSDTQDLTVTVPALPAPYKYSRRIYITDANDTPNFLSVHHVQRVPPDNSGTYTISFTADSFNNGTFVLQNERFGYPEGYLQQIRLYPRQNEDFELSVRYIYRPDRLVEDTDTPELPQSHHICLAYACLWDILNKHDNLSLGGIYKKKYMAEVIKMEQRFLTQKPRRFVKGFMKESGVDTLPMFTPLRRIP